MNARYFFVFSILLAVASVADAKGKYERTMDGKTRVWNNDRQPQVRASWSGERDDNGYASGRGTLTWYRTQRTWLTGSLLPTTKYIEVKRFSGKMVEGKLDGSVETVDAEGKTFHAKFADGQKKSDWVAGPLPSKKAAIAENKALATTDVPAEAPPPTPVLDQHVAEKTKEPAAQQLKEGAAQPPTETAVEPAKEAVTEAPKEAAAQAPKEAAKPPKEVVVETPKQVAVAEKSKETVVVETAKDEPAKPSDSLRSLAMPPSSLRVASLNAPSARPSAPPVEAASTPSTSGFEDSADARTVAALDTEYQAAVKTNDAATLDRILADDFVLVIGADRTLDKSDVLRQARDKQAKYEHHEVQEGTQKVRVWRDTAVVTATLWVKGTENGKPIDHKVSVSDTYVRTPAGWRHVSGQVSMPASASR